MAGVVRKLQILNGLAHGFMVQMYNVKLLFTDPKITPTFAKPANQKTAKAIAAKFPEIPGLDSKIPGFEIIRDEASDLLLLLEPYYQSFIDLIDFKDLAVKTMNEVVMEIAELKLEVNPSLTESFMDLYTALARLVYFVVYNLEERKLLITSYNMIYSARNSGQKEESLGRILSFMKDYASPQKKLQEDYRSLGPKVTALLLGMFPNFIKARTPMVLRKEGALSITLLATKLAQPAVAAVHTDIARAPKTLLWFAFGLMLSPEDLGGANVMDQLKLIIADSLHLHLFRDEYLSVYKEYENLFEYKSKTIKLEKMKKTLKEGSADGLATAGLKHRDRRIYARQELNTLYHLFKDTPALMAPKFPVVLAALAMAKEELFFWFRHRQVEKLKVQPQHFDDKTNITHLIYLMTNMLHLIREYKDNIQQYYIEYLLGPDAGRLSELVNDATFQKSVGSEVVSGLSGIINAIKSAQKGSNFANVREAWYQLEPILSSPSKMVPIPVLAPVVEKVSYIMQHMKYIDSFEEVLGEHGSIRELWYYRLEVRDVFTKSISDGPEQPTHAMGYLNFLSQAVENATIYDPNEKDRIGAESINMAHEFMEKIMERVFSLIEPIAKEYIHFDYQYADYMAIYPVLEKRPEFKADRNYRTPNPGSESQYVSRQSIETLRLYEKNVWQLCSALNDIGSLYIYNVVVTPREYLVERIRKLLKSVIARFSYLPQENQVFKDEHTIQTPAVLARSFFVYAGICKSLENYVDIDVGSVISYVLVHQSHAPSLGVVGQKLDWLTASAFDFSKNLIKVIVTWYSDFFSKRIAALTGPHSSTGAPHIIYSPLRQGFYSRRGNAFRVENYCDIKELRTLVSLVGPYGVKLIDRELLRLAQGHIAVIRDIMKQYGKELDEFYNVYQHEAKTALLIKQFRVPDVDNFVQRSIAVGAIFQYRKLVHQALSEVGKQTVPAAFDFIETTHSLYIRNTFFSQDVAMFDSVAHDYGVDTGTADPNLKTILLQMAQGDIKLWDMIPAMYAVSVVVSQYWRDAVFNATVGGHENNLHLLVLTVQDLTVALKGLTTEVGDEEEITDLLRLFLEMSSVLLLRQLSGASTLKMAPKDFASIFVFFDLFVDQSSVLKRGDIDSVIPYALLRSMWRHVTSSVKIMKLKTGEDCEDVF